MKAPCTHGMPTPASCVDCMYEGNLTPPPAPEPERRTSAVTVAIYDAQCSACNLPIHVGELVVKTTHHRWVHDGCAP